MTGPLFFEYLVYLDEDTRLFNLSEFIVYGGSKEPHGGRQAHISINQRRNVIPQRTYFPVENFIILLKAAVVKKMLHFSLYWFLSQGARWA